MKVCTPYRCTDSKKGKNIMMISPEEFYNESLKGKSTDQIMRVIRSLKREIGRLKNIVEHPDYSPTMCPTESTQIFCSKLYLEKAKLALLEIGETYTPTKAEQRAMAFDDNITNRYYQRCAWCSTSIFCCTFSTMY